MKIEYTKEREKEKELTFANLKYGDVFMFTGKEILPKSYLGIMIKVYSSSEFVSLCDGEAYNGNYFYNLESQPVRLVDAKLVVDEAEPIED